MMKYYETKFRYDLMRYSQDRYQNMYAASHRIIRFGTGGWYPDNWVEFCFSMYFTVLTDMAIHTHFKSKHYLFDSQTQYPKLYGMGDNRMLPSIVLFDVRIKREELAATLDLWENYCDYFINEWVKSLPSLCEISGKEFLMALLNDRHLLENTLKPKLELAETEEGGCCIPDGKGEVSDCSSHLESLLLGKISMSLENTSLL
ncbi:MAG: hypothetical protein PHV91_01325 [Bacteroidales bacterium]|nr:hypothetical protein [Candidatus Cloacimonadota bacterium]MDD3299460.1 hypothetical protein [Bacteroidales bacterium]